ncbi:hypothetical protein EON65_20275 [archaeon]|nr:MAG: hypothetical protein EON65_20275 [archaeon]
MGNEISQPPSKLGITSLGVTTPNIEAKEVSRLLQLLKSNAIDKQSEMISKDELSGILKQVEKFTPPDSELFIQLFVLFDEQGHDEVNYKTFIAGSSVCLTSSPLNERIKFALSIFDVQETQHCQRGDLKKALLAVNTTAAFFGDPVLHPSEVDTIVLEAFKAVPNAKGLGLLYDECIAYLLSNASVKKFMNAEGSVRFGSTELTA